MVSVHTQIALSHLTSRTRQTLVSLMGIVLGVAFFLAVSSLMRGSEQDFLDRLVNNQPHVTVSDEFRQAPVQPAERRFPGGAVEIRSVKPKTEVRGIRQYKSKLSQVDSIAGIQVAPVLAGQAIITFAGRDVGVTLSGVVPARMKGVSSIEKDITKGSLDDLDANPNGVIIGEGLAERYRISMGDNLLLASPKGQVRTLKVVGMFRTGNQAYDESQTFAALKRVQALMDRPNIANSFILRADDPYRARAIAAEIERRIGYKAVSWQEASEDIMSLLLVRNIIMYSVVLAILVVASFGIYNVISTVVLEKTRDIAILKSMGFHARDIRRIFVIEGAVVGAIGSLLGVLLGMFIMWVLVQIPIKPPGVAEVVKLPLYWGVDQFVLAIAFAMGSAVGAAWLPARKGGRVQPVDILRGAA
ncbi:ABC transporter permease [Parapedomonas caeni]